MVTMSDVAKRAGVSTPTVSFVLNDKQSRQTISEATKKRVWAAVEELGYRRNHAAKSMRTGLFGCAALVLSTSSERSYLPVHLLNGILEELDANGMHLVITKISDEKLTDATYLPGILRECMADGLLIDYINLVPEQMAPLLESRNIPSVWVNFQHKRDCIFPNDLKAIFDATNYLISMGHQKIAYFQPAYSEHYSYDVRRTGYENAMRSCGLESRIIDLDTLQPSAEKIKRIRTELESDTPTAILCYDGEQISPVFYTVTSEMGLHVPEDMSLITTHPHAFNEVGIDVTTWGVPFKQIGHAAVQSLLRRIKTPELPEPALPIDFEIHTGSTCAPPRVK